MSPGMVGDTRRGGDRDRGAVLLLVLAVSIVLSLVVLALANFVAADLRYSRVADGRVKTLSSAQSGIEYAVDRLRLNQTLCATDAATATTSLTGTAGGTSLPEELNGTDTTVTCARLHGDVADVAGWAVVIANQVTAPNDQIRVDMSGTAVINGPVFLPEPDDSRTELDSNSRVQVVDGDLWYTRTNCNPPLYSNPALVGEFIDIGIAPPSTTRGGICTTRTAVSTFPAPTAPVVSTPAPPSFLDPSGCRVFSPGRYNTFLNDLGPNNYFISGDYYMAYPGEGTTNVVIWAGGADPSDPAPQTANGPCTNARNADNLSSGRGATFYFAPGTSLRISNGGSFEVFGRRQGNHVVSIQGLYTGSGDPALVTTSPTGSLNVVMHGLVWAPFNRVVLQNSSSSTNHRFLGGMVVGRLHILDVHLPKFEITPAASTGDPPRGGDASILLTSTSTLDGVSTTVEAVVAYRPHALDPDQRVRVTSLRVAD